MPTPFNYLLTAPSDGEEALGKGMHSSDFVKKIRSCNPNLMVPDPSVHGWYPRKNVGHTTIWLGQPFVGRKITTIQLGIIPEWTQIDPRGLIIARGWRAALQKLIQARVLTRRAAEAAFKITLDTGKASDICQQCLKEGRGRVPTKAASKLCETHDHLTRQVRDSQRQKVDAPAALADQVSYLRRNPRSVLIGKGA